MKHFYVFTALCVSLILTQTAQARDYIIVLSPSQSRPALEAQAKDVLRFLMSEIK